MKWCDHHCDGFDGLLCQLWKTLKLSPMWLVWALHQSTKPKHLKLTAPCILCATPSTSSLPPPHFSVNSKVRICMGPSVMEPGGPVGCTSAPPQSRSSIVVTTKGGGWCLCELLGASRNTPSTATYSQPMHVGEGLVRGQTHLLHRVDLWWNKSQPQISIHTHTGKGEDWSPPARHQTWSPGPL